ncbi:GTP-binding protein Rho1 [Serendipita sp. 411]|nr:GTP-binding protein Rho1 [Serendipita sp. 411]
MITSTISALSVSFHVRGCLCAQPLALDHIHHIANNNVVALNCSPPIIHSHLNINRNHKSYLMAPIRKKVIVVGDGACGKTSLVGRLCTGELPGMFIPTVYERTIVDCRVDGEPFELDIVDTAGQEDYERIRPLAYSGADIVLICFSVDMPDSLENIVCKWVEEVQYFCPNVPYFVVGCKKDLRYDVETLNSLKSWGMEPTTPEMGEAVRCHVRAEMYFECSAKENEGIEAIFEHAVKASPSFLQMTKRKLLVIGDSGSGKTSLMGRLYWGQFLRNGNSLLSNIRTACLEVDARPVQLALVEVARCDSDDSQWRATEYSRAHAILICFSIDQPDSLQSVQNKWVPEILHFCPRIPYLLVGCKSDLRSSTINPHLWQEQIQQSATSEDGQAIARRTGAQMYLECSAKTNVGVVAVFESAARAALTVKEKSETKSGLFGFLKGAWGK